MADVLVFEVLPTLQHLTDLVFRQGVEAKEFEREFLAGIIRITASGKCTHLTTNQAGTLASLYAKFVLVPLLPKEHRRRRDDKPRVICKTCQDTHRIEPTENSRGQSCTSCPTPCENCRSDSGRGAYCAETPCPCECHKDDWRYKDPRPDPPRKRAAV